MKNLYTNKVNKLLSCLVLLFVLLFGNTIETNAQVKKTFTQRTSAYSPTQKIYNVKGDFTMLGNTSLTPQNYSDTQNNNGQVMTYVDKDSDLNTFNSSSSTLVLSSENGAIPSCSNIVYAGLYWTGKSSANETFSVTKNVQTGTQFVNNNLTVVHNQNIANTNYALSIGRNNPSNSNRNPIYTFNGNGNSYVFNFFNSGATNRVTLSINSAAAIAIPVTVNGTGTLATLTTPYIINDGGVVLTIRSLTRSAATNLSTGDTQSTSSASVNVTGNAPVFGNVTKNFNKRQVSLKGPGSSSYTTVTASTNDIYYPSGSDDNIFSAYTEITDYVKTNGIGEYWVADMPLLEGNITGTGYSGGWGMIIIYENSKMKWRDITIFDGYAYVSASNTTGFDLPVSGFNAVQYGNVGVKLGTIASEGDVSFTGDYFRISNRNTAVYTDLSHSGNSTSNFFNSSINSGGARNPQLLNNTGIDVAMFNINNTGNAIINNEDQNTNFRYGTTSDTYSIFAIAMAIDAYVPETEGVLTTTTINNLPAVTPFEILPGQDAGFSIDIRNLGTEAVNNYKVIVPIPYNASYVPGSASGTLYYTVPNTTITGTFDPSLGSTGSIVWDFGTLPLPVNPSVLLAKLTFKLKATTDCAILNNASCASTIAITGNSIGKGNTTNVDLRNSNLIQGFTQNGSCLGEPIPTPLNLGINGSTYVKQNCPNTNIVRNFTYCSTNTTVGTSEIASNFPPGSLFYNEFPVTVNSIQYSDANPIPLVAGSTEDYYAVPAGGGSGCNFPFTVSKCPRIIAQDDTLSGGNGAIGNPNIGNVFNTNGNGPDTLNGSQTNTSQVNLTIITPAAPINGGPVPSIDTATGQVSVPQGTPSGTYTITYEICEIGNLTNCDTAIVTITVVCPTVAQPTLECYQTAVFNTTTCVWDVTGTQPDPPTELKCYQIATFNPTTCQYDVTGTQPAQPTVACYETATWNPISCQYDVTGTQPVAPEVLCYQTATFNLDTCQYDVTGEQPAQPTLACYESATFNATTCIWDVTGTQPTQPTVACYETATFNTTTCVWDVTGTQPQIPSLNNVVGLCSATVTAPTFTIGCSGEVITATTTDPLVYNNQGAFTITWTFNNNNGFFQVLTQNVIVDDMIAPTFDQVAPADLEVSCDNIPPMAVLTATDACGPVTVISNEQITPGDCPNRYTITRTWDVTDANGNAAPTQTQTITVVDNAGPILTSTVELKLQVNCASIPDAPQPVFEDNCSGVVTVAFEETQTEVVNNQYSITRTWIAKDACGNASEEIEQVIYVDVIAEIVATENSEICNAAEFDTINLTEELPVGTPTGGTWINVDNVAGLNGTIFSPYNGGNLVPVGDYTFSYIYDDGTDCPSRVDVLMNVNDICKPLDCGNIIVHNAFTPNGDGVNEYFDIENIQDFTCYPTNKVEIYNRWGVLVYETEQYDNASRRFEGISEGRATVDKSAELPTGTYFYILQYTTSDGDTISESKYLYLTR